MPALRTYTSDVRIKGRLFVDGGILSTVTAGAVNVKAPPFNAVGDGVADDGAAILAAKQAAVVAGGVVVFPPGTYAYATSVNWEGGGSRLSVLGIGNVTLKHTGTGSAFVVDGNGIGRSFLCFENLIIEGNANSTHGLYVRDISKSRFINLRVKGCSSTGSACVLDGTSVLNTFDMFSTVASSNTAANGVQLASTGISANLFTNFDLAGVTGAGILVTASSGNNVFLGGTSEGNATGISLLASGGKNLFIGLDLESNTSRDIDCAGSGNQFLGCLAISTANPCRWTATAFYNHVSGGQYQAIDVQASAFGNRFENLQYNFGGSKTFVDSGTKTLKAGVLDATLGTFDADRIGAAFAGVRASLSYSASVAVNAALGSCFDLGPTNNTNFQINNPTNALDGQVITITVRNIAGGPLGTLTWDTLYKLAAWTQPAAVNSRSITFKYNGTNWVEIGRTTVDVPN